MNLLDYVDDPSSEPGQPHPAAPEPAGEWQEVPAARFLSWSAGEQMAYCAARDYDSAVTTDNLTEAAWFIDRAKMYEGMIR